MAATGKLNPIIEQLSRIDKMAAAESARAEGRKEALLDEFEAKKAEFDAGLAAQSQKRLEELRAASAKETAKKLEAVREEYAAREKRLDESYETCAKQWAENIFNSVIGG